MAILFLTTVGVVILAVLGFAQSNLAGVDGYRLGRNRHYTADSAMQSAIAWAANTPTVGRDPSVPGATNCLNKSTFKYKGADQTIVVTCVPSDLLTGDPATYTGNACSTCSGVANDNGVRPANAIVTLGQLNQQEPLREAMLTDPHTSGAAQTTSLAERCSGTTWDSNDYREFGIRAKGDTAAAPGCAVTSTMGNPVIVDGNVSSNSPIAFKDGTTLSNPGGTTTTRSSPAEPACEFNGQFTGCIDAGAGNTTRPDVALPAQYGLFPTDATTVPLRSVPPVSACSANRIVKFTPGLYNDATAMKNLFDAPACAGTIFWFQPNLGPNGNLDLGVGGDDTEGIYLFDFRSGSLGRTCGNDNGALATNHEWCLDHAGQRIVAGSPNDTNFPDSSAIGAPLTQGEKNGAACNPFHAGAQFVFGGDTHLNIAGSSVEICAGAKVPAGVSASHQQIGISAVPAIPSLKPGAVNTLNNNTSITTASPGNNVAIGEPFGIQPISFRFTDSTDCRGVLNLGTCTDDYEGGLSLPVAAYSPPAGMKVVGVQARIAYNSASNCSSPIYADCFNDGPNGVFGFPGGATPHLQDQFRVGSCTTNLPAGQQMQQTTVTLYDASATNCIGASATSVPASTPVYAGKARRRCFLGVCTKTFYDLIYGNTGTNAASRQLDGLEYTITLAATNAGDSVLVPQGGCTIGSALGAAPRSPEYWYGGTNNTSSCATVKVGPNGANKGRLSVQGTTYVPSGAIDVNDADVAYPVFGRGVVARTIRIRGWKNRAGDTSPFASNQVEDPTQTTAGRRAFFVACLRGPGRALVTTECSLNPNLDTVLLTSDVSFNVNGNVTGLPVAPSNVPVVHNYVFGVQTKGP